MLHRVSKYLVLLIAAVGIHAAASGLLSIVAECGRWTPPSSYGPTPKVSFYFTPVCGVLGVLNLPSILYLYYTDTNLRAKNRRQEGMDTRPGWRERYASWQSFTLATTGLNAPVRQFYSSLIMGPIFLRFFLLFRRKLRDSSADRTEPSSGASCG